MEQEVQRKQENERKDGDCVTQKIHYNKNNIPSIFHQSGSGEDRVYAFHDTT